MHEVKDAEMDKNIDIEKSWQEVLSLVKAEYDLSEISYLTWLAPLKVWDVNEKTGVMTIMVPAGGMGVSYISRKYAYFLRSALCEILGQDFSLHFVTAEEAKAIGSGTLQKADNKTAAAMSNLNPDYTFDQFVVGPHNKLAWAASEHVTQNPGNTLYNPLYLYGGAGLGKTHLMQAIGNRLLSEHPDLKVVYVSSDVFTNELIAAIRNGQSNSSLMNLFRDKYRNADVFLIDDIQFLIGKEATQKEFFHTFNILFDAHKQIIISSDRPPRDLDVLDERYRSRCGMGLQTAITAPDYETRVAILKKMDKKAEHPVDDEIIAYMAASIESNIRTLLGAYNKVQAVRQLSGGEMTLDMAKDCLQDIILPPSEKIITPAYIADIVAEHFNIRTEDIFGRSRKRSIVYPRQLVMFLSREMTDLSEEAIGEMIGGRDHSTVAHSVDKIQDDMKISEETLKTVNALRKMITSPIH